MDRLNRIQAAQILVFATCTMFIIAFSVPDETFLAAQKQEEDDWVVYPMHISPLSGSSPIPIGYTPIQIRMAYGLPSSGGAGTTIAIVDAYDTPSIWDDLGNFSSQFGLPTPNPSNFEVHKMPGTIATDSGWAQETCLDVEWAHAIAPDAKILLVEAVNKYSSSLLSAVNYSTSYPGVVAVSMSWGSNESSSELNSDYRFNKPGIAFFASSGDDGSGIRPYWPASSPYVIAVGGTTLKLNSDGTLISETAWNGSGGGISNFEPIPTYQTNYGLTPPNRAVPDVSYNANPATGVAVYCNSSWMGGKVGGTSAGAPQWAAIYALGLSATNVNLYQRAKSSYSSYFRDITSGSNGAYKATDGYDLVTGLGSPLTFKFGTSLDVSPTSGPAGSLITLNGLGFTPGGSVNISYLNQTTSTWTSIINNFPIDAVNGSFTYSPTAPDLGQNNTAGDYQEAFDNIVFRAQDNSNNQSCNSTVPYSEMRRGLTQITNTSATGLFGTSTNLASTVFVQNGQSIAVSGNWFNPGTASMLWDDSLSLGTAQVDGTGFFNATVQVPTTSAGQHRLTINDGSSNFCVNLTRLPAVANDYVDEWHTSNFAVNLTPDYAVNETFYSLNSGPVYNVTANGQPIITTEGSGNTLEYWSTWNVYGISTMELPHVTLTGIKLAKIAPVGSITTGATTTQTPTITLAVSATDTTSGIAQMRFSNDNATWSDWEPSSTSKTWILPSGDGQKTVFVQFMNNAGLASTSSYTLTLQTPQPTVAPFSTTSPTATHSSTPTPTPTSAPTPTASPSPTTSPTPSVPEIPMIAAILVILVITILAVTLTRRRK
jgi:hypothetical protein